jgi:arabinofuranosyltransferase
MDNPPAERARRTVDGETFLLVAGVLLFLVVLLRHAWLCDDAFITFRTVRNFVQGRGLTWNFGQRVQVFTHPLWMLLVSALYFVTREIFYSVVGLSVALSTAAVVLFARRIAPSAAAALFGLAAFVASKAFMDYSTSGLENPLTHLLYLLFLSTVLGRISWRRSQVAGSTQPALLPLALLAGLMATNRLDALLLCLPILAHLAWPYRRDARLWKQLALGFAPLVLWELFSLLYFGFPFPNTYYAKLGASIPRWALLLQGCYYYLSAINQDPFTLMVTAAALVLALFERRPRTLAIAGGLLLYHLYVISIGGDFMLGRFYATPFLGAVVLLGDALARLLPATGASRFIPAPLVLVLGFAITPRPPLRNDSTYSIGQPQGQNPFDERGVADERGYYYPMMGLLHGSRAVRMPADPRVQLGETLTPDKASVRWAVGTLGWGAPPRAIIVDQLGLADPLLARLPLQGDQWRIGHLPRRVPDGYLETLERGENRLADRKLAKVWDQLSLVVSGPMFSWARWKAIWWLNTGGARELIDVDFYRR